MIDINDFSLAAAIQKSEDYKIVVDGGWVYVFPSSLDFAQLEAARGRSKWDQLAVLFIDDDGYARKNRHGSERLF